MKNISIIACIGKKNELGRNNDLIWHIKEDLLYFKEKTLNHTVVMGRKTYLSLPKRPLKNRTNIVLMQKEEETFPGIIIYNDIESILNYAKIHSDEEIFIIGGASIYNAFIDYADKLYLTEVEDSQEASVYFPEFDKSKYNKTIIKESKDENVSYTFTLYERK